MAAVVMKVALASPGAEEPLKPGDPCPPDQQERLLAAGYAEEVPDVESATDRRKTERATSRRRKKN